MIVDAHAHSFPSVRGWLNGKETRSLSYGKVKIGSDYERWFPPSFVDSASPIELLIEYMDWNDISKAIVTQGPMYGLHNDYLIEEQKRHHDRIRIFGILERYTNAQSLDALSNMAQAGMCGLKFELESIISNDTQFRFDSSEVMSVCEQCQASGLSIMVHPVRGEGTEVAIAKVIDTFPRLKIIIAHLGLAPFPGWESKIHLAKRENVFLDCSGLPASFDSDEYPYVQAQGFIKWAVDQVGSEKILWGSDYPALLRWCTYRQTLDIVRSSNVLSDMEKERILGTNAARVFGFL